MQDALKNDLLRWVHQFHDTCLALNEELIRSFKLDDEPLLVGRDRFGLPSSAVRQKVIPRWGSLPQQPVTYHLHGIGITFVIEERISVSFEYYPRVSVAATPLWGCSTVAQFIRSTEPLHPLGDATLLRDSALALVQEGVLGRVDDHFFQFYLRKPGELYTPMATLTPC
jgi:hypothetical protein